MIQELTKQLNRDEGRDKFAYKDSLGFWTIGIGRLVDKNKGGGLRDCEMDFMLANDIQDRIEALTRALPWFQNLDDARRGVLLNMSFQLGVEGLLAFKNTLESVRVGNWQAAANGMAASKWAAQTPERAARLGKQMISGVWQ